MVEPQRTFVLWLVGLSIFILIVFIVSIRVVGAAVAGDSWSTNSTALPAVRHNIKALNFDNKLWIFSGTPSNQKVYRSSDGETWAEEGSDVFPVSLINYRAATFTVASIEYMFVTGGSTGSGVDEVFRSLTGASWTTFTDSLPSPLYNHCTFVHDDLLWSIGGLDDSDVAQDTVYSSSDGTTWSTIGTLDTVRSQHSCLSFHDQLWVIGGNGASGEVNTVSSSFDGITWTDVGTLPDTILSHESVVYDGRMWVLGGLDGVSELDTIYSSTDGVTWVEVGNSALPAATRNFGSAVFEGRIWVIGGESSGGTRDVHFTDSIVGNISVSRPVITPPDIARNVADIQNQPGDVSDANLPLGWVAQIAADGTGYPIRFFWLIAAGITVIGTGLGLLAIAKGNIFIPATGTVAVSLMWFAFGDGIIPFVGVVVIGAITLLTSLIVRESVAA